MVVVAEKNLMAVYDDEEGPSMSRILGRDCVYHNTLAKKLTRIACNDIYDYKQTPSCFVTGIGDEKMMRLPMKKKEQTQLQPQQQEQPGKLL